ncbi:MAG: DUF1801 domain-containing protein [Bacteroidetes bacterium]|nr:DUF1801 domain-containing protein [Bacteroidota bacterium]
MNENKILSINDYLKRIDNDKKLKLIEIRNLVKLNFPEAIETISFKMPAFKLNGKILIYFAAFKNHISIFPAPRTVNEFESELKNYKGGKGTIQFTDGQPIPVKLIEKILIFRAQTIINKNKKSNK